MGGRVTECYCNVNFTLDTDFKVRTCSFTEVFRLIHVGFQYSPEFYFHALKFHRVMFSIVNTSSVCRDDVQLLGQLSKDVSAECKPYDYGEDMKPIAPCGAIANSMFNGFPISFKNFCGQ